MKFVYPILLPKSLQPLQSLPSSRGAEPAPSKSLAMGTEATVAILPWSSESLSSEESSTATAAAAARQSSFAAEASSLIGTFQAKACYYS